MDSGKKRIDSVIPMNFKHEKNRKLVLDYISFRLNPKSLKLPVKPITIARCRKIAFSLQKIDNEIDKQFILLSEKDIVSFFDNLKSGEINKSKRVKVKGDIPILRTKVPYSSTAVRNIWSDFSNFWAFLVEKKIVKDILKYIKKP